MSDSEFKASALSIKLNYALVVSLLLASVYYFSALSIVTAAIAAAAVALAFGVYKYRRWAYFGCAAACFGAFWLARTEQDFVGDKRVVMSLSLPLMVFALYLHEKIVPKINNFDERGNV